MWNLTIWPCQKTTINSRGFSWYDFAKSLCYKNYWKGRFCKIKISLEENQHYLLNKNHRHTRHTYTCLYMYILHKTYFFFNSFYQCKVSSVPKDQYSFFTNKSLYFKTAMQASFKLCKRPSPRTWGRKSMELCQIYAPWKGQKRKLFPPACPWLTQPLAFPATLNSSVHALRFLNPPNCSGPDIPHSSARLHPLI